MLRQHLESTSDHSILNILYKLSADSVVNGTMLSSFEFGGQKCSACSRLYVPDTIWPQV